MRLQLSEGWKWVDLLPSLVIPAKDGVGWCALPDEALGPGLRRGDGNVRFGIDC